MLARSISFQRTARSDRVSAVIRRTHPEYQNHSNPVNTFFRCRPGAHRRQRIDPSPQHPAPHRCGARCFPVGSRATRARRTGLPATGRSRGTRSECGPLTRHPGGDAAQCGDAGAPGKTFEISGKSRGVNPKILPTRQTRFHSLDSSDCRSDASRQRRVSGPASKSGLPDYALAPWLSTQKIARTTTTAPHTHPEDAAVPSPAGLSRLTRTISFFPPESSMPAPTTAAMSSPRAVHTHAPCASCASRHCRKRQTQVDQDLAQQLSGESGAPASHRRPQPRREPRANACAARRPPPAP